MSKQLNHTRYDRDDFNPPKLVGDEMKALEFVLYLLGTIAIFSYIIYEIYSYVTQI